MANIEVAALTVAATMAVVIIELEKRPHIMTSLRLGLSPRRLTALREPHNNKMAVKAAAKMVALTRLSPAIDPEGDYTSRCKKSSQVFMARK